MEKQHVFKLIDGQFNPSEAKNILFALLNSKINFHSLESLGIAIRTNGDVSVHEKRIKELKQTNSSIYQLLEFAQEKKMKVKVNSLIEIELINGRKRSKSKI